MPEEALQTLLFADVAAIHFGLALVMGALACQLWLRHRDDAWARQVLLQSRTAQRGGAGVTFVASALGLWMQAAVMGDVPLLVAGTMITMVLRDTHFGHAWLLGLGAWAMMSAAVWRPDAQRWSIRRFVIGCFGVAGFALSRSVVSHAGSAGDFTLAVGIDWIHLVMVCLWVGIVLLGASVRLPTADSAHHDYATAMRWAALLSSTATGALILIGLTGIFKTWQSTPTFDALASSSYGRVLAVKLILVAGAVALGGVNRFLVIPSMFASPRVEEGFSWRGRNSFVWILRVEAFALTLALVAAAVLSASQPPIDD